MQKRRYKAKIGEKSYIIIGPGSEEHMAHVTSYLNEQLAQLKRISPGITDEEASVLLAFNATSSLMLANEAEEQHDNETKTSDSLFDAGTSTTNSTEQESD